MHGAVDFRDGLHPRGCETPDDGTGELRAALDGPRNTFDLRERGGIEDITISGDEADYGGGTAAEDRVHPIVELHVGMALRELVALLDAQAEVAGR